MKRIYHDNNGILAELSTELENYHTGTATIDIVSADDAIFIGSELPFNSLYFDVSSANDQTSTPTVSYWDGGAWVPMVDLIDETNGLFVSGHMTWVTDKSKIWAKEDTVYHSGGEQITDLGDVTVYDLYWLKITYSADLNASTTLNWVGTKFCSDNDLEGEYSLFGRSGFITAYESGKTDWEKEIILASRLVVEELIDKGSIVSGDQLLERRKLRDATVSRTAQLIFTSMGDDYEDDRVKARNEFKSRMNKKNYKADLNANARLDESEKGMVNGILYR
jgi:hypothetical protein